MNISPGNWNKCIRRPSLEALPPLSLAARYLLAELEQRYRRWGPIRASVRQLAEELECSATGVSRALKALEAAGLITRSPRGLMLSQTHALSNKWAG